MRYAQDPVGVSKRRLSLARVPKELTTCCLLRGVCLLVLNCLEGGGIQMLPSVGKDLDPEIRRFHGSNRSPRPALRQTSAMPRLVRASGPAPLRLPILNRARFQPAMVQQNSDMRTRTTPNRGMP